MSRGGGSDQHVQTTYSEWQKRPVPTFRPGSKSSIQECIDRAPPFARVIVLGGIYNEQLVINKPIELIGEEGEDPVVNHKAPVMQIHNDVECYVQRLNIQAKSTIKHGGSSSSSGTAAKEAPAVMIGGQAKPVFKNCEITSVMVTSTADPQFVHCHIGKNSNGPCISVRDHASGTYLQCKFRDCSTYCVEVCSRGEPKFIDNTVEADGKDASTAGSGLLHVHGGKDVRPVFQANRFEDLIDTNSVARYVNTVMYSSRRTAVVIDGFAEPVFEDNMFVGSEICVTLRACGGLFRNNTVTSSRSCGVYIRTGCSMLLQENKIQGNATYGVVLDGCESAQLDGNHIASNSHAGCLIVHSSNFSIINNHFVSNAGGGLCVWENAKGTISENDFRMNQRYGAYFYGTDCQVNFKQNRLIHNAPAGIVCENGCTPHISLNEIASSPVAGIWITTSANPLLSKNTVSECERYGVIVTANGRGKLLKNTIRGGREAALFVTDGANPVVQDNDISEGSLACVLVSEGGIGDFNGNRVRNCAFGVVVRLFADPVFRGNIITQCGEGGIVSEEEGIGTFVDNTIEKCASGFLCGRGGEAAFRDNTVRECTAAGAMLKGGSRAVVEKNTFDGNAVGIQIRGEDAQPLVRKNVVNNSTTYGICTAEKAAGDVLENHILLSGTAALASVEEGSSYFYKNRCTQERGHGILCRREGTSKFVDNHVEFACGSGVLVDQKGRPEISRCKFTGCKGYGIEIATGSEGSIDDCEVSDCEIGFKGHGAACKTVVTNVRFEANRELGALLVDNAEATLNKCSFTNHPKIALAVRNSGASLLENCTFLDNHIGVESTLAGSLTTLRQCRLSGEECNIHVDYHAGGDVRLDDCVIQDGKVGVRFRDRGKGLVRDTHISRVKGPGLLFGHLAMGAVQASVVASCEIGCQSLAESKGHVAETVFEGSDCNVEFQEKAGTELARCEMLRAAKRPGVDCYKSLGSFANCRVHNNERGGIRVHGARTRTSFTDCTVYGNGDYGVEGTDRCECPFVGNMVEDNRGPGVIYGYQCGMHFSEKNTVRRNGYFGVLCEDGSDGLFAAGVIDGHHTTANVKLDPGSQTRFERNTITDGKVGVINEGSSSTVFMNKITKHRVCAVQVFGKSMAVFDSNEIEGNMGGGVSFGKVFELSADEKDDGHHHGSGGHTAAAADENRRMQRRASQLAKEGLATAGGLVTRMSTMRRSTSVSAHTIALQLQQQQQQQQQSQSHLVDGVETSASLSDFASDTAKAADDELTAEEEKEEKEKSMWPYARERRPDATQPISTIPSCATFRSNTFSANGYSGAVRLGRFSAGVFNSNTFRDEKRAMVVEDDARGSVEENTFTDNDVAVIINGPTTTAHIAHNSFKRNGVCFELGAIRQPTFSIRENVCEDSSDAAVVVGDGCQGTVQQFECKGGGCGMRITAQAEINVTECVFSGCSDAGIIVEGHSKPGISRCRFDSECNVGMRLLDCSAVVSCCVFVGALRAGMTLESPGCSAKATRCLFTQNAANPDSVGVLMRNKTSGELTFCDFHENSWGLRCEDNAEGSVTQCLVHRQVHGGVHCTTGSSTRFKKNSFAQNGQCDIVSSNTARPEIQRCLFRGDAAHAVKCSAGGGIVTDCAFRGYSEAAVQLVVAQGASISKCFFTACDAAMMSTGKTPAHACDFVSNVVSACRTGVRVHLGPGLSVNHNIISGCESVGIELRHLGTGCTVSHNHVFKCGAGIKVHDIQAQSVAASTTLSNNLITDFSTGTGMEVTTAGPNGDAGAIDRTFVVQENYISGCRHGLNMGDGSPRVSKNQVQSCDHGMTIQRGNSGAFEGNVTHSCARIGTLIYSPDAEVQRNYFCASGESGALEVKNDPNGGNSNRQGGNVRGNEVKNSYVPHWAKAPDAPTPDFVTVSDIKLSKEEQAAMNVLRKMYQEEELFPGPECLCDLVSPISPAARDVSRVSLLARPKGKTADEKAAEALSSMKDGGAGGRRVSVVDPSALGSSSSAQSPSSPGSSMRTKNAFSRVRNSVRLSQPSARGGAKRDDSSTGDDAAGSAPASAGNDGGSGNAGSGRRRQSTRLTSPSSPGSTSSRRKSVVPSSPSSSTFRRGGTTRKTSTTNSNSNKPSSPGTAGGGGGDDDDDGNINITDNYEEPRFEESVHHEASEGHLELTSGRNSAQQSLRSGSSGSRRSNDNNVKPAVGRGDRSVVKIIDEDEANNTKTSVVGEQILEEQQAETQEYTVDEQDEEQQHQQNSTSHRLSLHNSSLPPHPITTAEERARERQAKRDRDAQARADRIERQRLIEQSNRHLAFVKLDGSGPAGDGAQGLVDGMASSSSSPPPPSSPLSASQRHQMGQRIVLALDGQLNATPSMDEGRILRALSQGQQHSVHGAYDDEHQELLRRQQLLADQMRAHETQQQKQQQQQVGPGQAIHTLQLASPDAVIRARIRESHGVNIKQGSAAAAVSPRHLLYTGRDAEQSTQHSTDQLMSTITAPARTVLSEDGHLVDEKQQRQHEQQLAAIQQLGGNPYENRLGRDDIHRQRDPTAVDEIVPVEEEEDEAPVGESFKIKSLSQEAGVMSPEGVPTLPPLDKVNWVSPSSGGDEQHGFKPVTNYSSGTDPDLESPGRQQQQKQHGQVPGLFSYSADLPPHLQQQEQQQQQHYVYQQDLPSPPSSAPSQQPANHYDKASRLMQKVAGYDKNIGSAFSSRMTSVYRGNVFASGAAHASGVGGSPSIPDRKSSPLAVSANGEVQTARVAGGMMPHQILHQQQQQGANSPPPPPATVRHWASASTLPFARKRKTEVPLQQAAVDKKAQRQQRAEMLSEEERRQHQVLRIGMNDEQQQQQQPQRSLSPRRADVKTITRAIKDIEHSGASDRMSSGSSMHQQREAESAVEEAAAYNTVQRWVVPEKGTAHLVSTSPQMIEQQRQQNFIAAQQESRAAVQQIIATKPHTQSPPGQQQDGSSSSNIGKARLAGLRIGNFGSPPPPTASSDQQQHLPLIKKQNSGASSARSKNHSQQQQQQQLPQAPPPPPAMTARELAKEAAKLQAKSDIRRSDLMHSTTAQMFAAFDRRAGALGNLM